MRIYDTVVLAPVNRMPGVKFVDVSPAVAQIECGRATALGTRWRMSDWAGRCLEETVNRHSIRVHVGNGTAHWTGAGCRDPDHARVVTDVSWRAAIEANGRRTMPTALAASELTGIRAKYQSRQRQLEQEISTSEQRRRTDGAHVQLRSDATGNPQ
jgi:hypothetical protein